MKLSSVSIRNFRRLEDVTIEIEDKETVFVGPNNSGKTSATAIFRCFLGSREFTIHDFSVGRIEEFNSFGEPKKDEPIQGATEPTDTPAEGAVHEPKTSGEQGEIEKVKLPEISLDLLFAIDPESIAFGRVFTLLQRLNDAKSVGLSLTYGVIDPEKLRSDYFSTYPETGGVRAKTLFEFLSLEGHLSKYCGVRHFSLQHEILEDGSRSQKTVLLDPDEGKRLLKHLVRVEFVDAQRNINDDDGSRSNRLSSAFASYYRKNLEQIGYAAEAQAVIDKNNLDLTGHYDIQFAPLMKLIRDLGVPSINDRELRIISALSPELALRGSTELIYVDTGRNHRLPELYNGLGFKNLIYMAIQARHFHSQWIATAESRPLCLLIFIEEPEVHLHAQVQQTFISNIWSVIKDSAEAAGEADLVPQLVITTHSSHILDTVDFEKVRYFQRCHLRSEPTSDGIRNASAVRSLRAFRPDDETTTEEKDAGTTKAATANEIEEQKLTKAQVLEFLKRYLRLTHCDLFFADAAILVEGAAERLLLPTMIDRVAGKLRGTYLTVLEVGGAYAHRFESLLTFLKIPYLVITDLDSVAAKGYPSTCRGDTDGARTSNATLKKLCNVNTVAELLTLTKEQKRHADKDRCISFQTHVDIEIGGVKQRPIPRTLEEAIAYENFNLVVDKTLSIGASVASTWPDAYQNIYERISSDGFKKTDFAMSLLAMEAGWIVPGYIAEGLSWLEARLCPSKVASKTGAA